MRSRLAPALVAVAVLAVACGSDDDGGGGTDVATADDTVDDTGEDTGDDTAGETAVPTTAGSPEPGDSLEETGSDETGSDDEGTDQAAPSAGGQGAATLTLDNGESYEFSVLCTLEPQMAAGSEILFTATSYDDPGLDITQFGDEGTVTGVGTVSVYDGDFETLWEASTSFEAFGGGLELTLDGSTIRGTGTFYPEADPVAGDGIAGEVVANC